MYERFVEIPVKKEIRDKIKRAKGILSYNEYFEKLLAKNNTMND